jgi:NarL family two-component system sensor histidine kinase LiaS
MKPQRSLGLQWKLAAMALAVSLLSSGLVAIGYYLATQAGAPLNQALAIGLGVGLLTGLFGAYLSFQLARSIKLRVWDASDMAGRIAGGDLSARLMVGRDDELGWLEQQLNEMANQLEGAVGDLKGLAEQNRQLNEEAVRGAALEERARLARDLHDTVTQQLFVLAMRAAAARKRLERLGGDAAGLVPELGVLEELARGAHSQTRDLILQLRPTTLEQQGLGPALAEYVTAAALKEGWRTHLSINPLLRVSGPTGENLFRVAQEALNNMAKHAQATSVWVSLADTPAGLLLRLRDDGRGFDLQADVGPTAVGLVGMQERIEQLGGSLRIQSSPGEGAEVTVLLPRLSEGGESE